MGGIRCHKCGATVSSAAAKARLAADGIKWTVNSAVKVICAGAIGGLAAGGAENPSESGVLAEQYNAQGYKCVNGHSESWVNAN